MSDGKADEFERLAAKTWPYRIAEKFDGVVEKLVVIALLVLMQIYFHVIGITYPRFEDSLVSPVEVKSISGREITLEDGRIFVFAEIDSDILIKTLIKLSDYRIDIESIEGEDSVKVYAQALAHVQNCFPPMVRIPIIPVDHTRHRYSLGEAAQAENSKK